MNYSKLIVCITHKISAKIINQFNIIGAYFGDSQITFPENGRNITLKKFIVYFINYHK